MLKVLLRTCLIAMCSALAFTPSTAFAQQMIHAITGTVTAVYPKIGTIEVSTDDGSLGHFKCLTKSGAHFDFDKNIRADSVEADKFTTVGSHVIVYFFGDSDNRTAVALRDLGTTPVLMSRGTVVKLSRKEHLLTIKNATGGEESFTLDPKTVGDTPTGVAIGLKFDFDKGAPVRVMATQANGNQSALLIAPVM